MSTEKIIEAVSDKLLALIVKYGATARVVDVIAKERGNEE